MWLQSQVAYDVVKEHQCHSVRCCVCWTRGHEGQAPQWYGQPAEWVCLHRWETPEPAALLSCPAEIGMRGLSRVILRSVEVIHLKWLCWFVKNTFPNVCKFLSTDFILHQSVASESLSVDTFSYKNDVYVAISAPSTESCMIFQWDHIEMNFRTYDNITGKVWFCLLQEMCPNLQHNWKPLLILQRNLLTI